MKYSKPTKMPAIGDTVIVVANGDANISAQKTDKLPATVVSAHGGTQLNLNIHCTDHNKPVKHYTAVRHGSETGDTPEASEGQCYWITAAEDK